MASARVLKAGETWITLTKHPSMSPSEADALFAWFYDTEWFRARPAPVQQLLRRCPPWGFYVRRAEAAPLEERLALRLTGVDECSDGSLRFRTYSAHQGWINGVVGGDPADGLERVPQWSGRQLECIHSLPEEQQEAFLEPDGFVSLCE